MERTVFDPTKIIEAVNLKVNGIESTGNFFYHQAEDHRFSPPIALCRDSWLEFNAICIKSKQNDFVQWLTHHDEIEITEDGKIYKGFVSYWELVNHSYFSGNIVLINKWYE